MTIGQKLSEMRRRAGLTQDAVSEHLGVTPQAVSKRENDASCPDITFLPEIARLYKTTVDEILSTEALTDVALISEDIRKDVSEMILHINVDSAEGDMVRLNLPMKLIAILTKSGGMGSLINIGNIDMSSIDFNSILAMVHSGVIGKLLEIRSANGDLVTIEVE